MATVDKAQADRVVAGEFKSDGCWKIVCYDNAWGGESYGLIFKGDDPDKYRASNFVRNPTVYWEKTQ